MSVIFEKERETDKNVAIADQRYP